MPIIDGYINQKSRILLTDSRFLSQASNTIFIAIKGKRHDGHFFIEEMIKDGVKEFLVNENWIKKHPELIDQANFWIAQNTVKALQELAKKHREEFNLPVVAITGSNGKTIVKEWLSTLLQTFFSLVKSPRSYNSQIGVPLSVWELNENHNLGIFEAGISMQSEMQNLQEIIQPSIGIFTNIGSAHDAGFRSRKQKITEKLRLFRQVKTLIYCQDYHNLHEEIGIFLKAVNPKIKLIAWSKEQKGSIQVETIKKNKYSILNIYWNGEDYELRIPFTDDASIENSIHCFFAAFVILNEQTDQNLILPSIQRGVDSIKAIPMRLELKEGIRNCYIIDDSYNNDFGGLSMALNFMNQQHSSRNKTIILSDVLQSGLKEKDLYQGIDRLLIGSGVTKIIGIGNRISKNKSCFKHIICHNSVEDFLENYPIQTFTNELILVKGARNFAFEKIVNQLINKVHGTVFDINLDALTHNLNYYKSRLKGDSKIMAMVKASAYGSGSTEIANLLQYHRVDYLAVAYTDEGVELRENGIELPILVLNAQPESYAKLLEYELEPEIYSLNNIREFCLFLDEREASNDKVKIHLKVDTGMNRLGFLKKDISSLIQWIAKDERLQIASIFSHLAASDSKTHQSFTKSQIEKFDEISTELMANLSYQPLRHLLNSAGIIQYPEASYQMVRLGIGLYGIESSNSSQEELMTVGTLKTTITQIKQVKKGDSIGYSRAGIAPKDMEIATIAIGYADGFDRHLSNGKGQVWIKGKLCPTIGNICMDMSMIDVSLADVKEGDSVEIFGTNHSIFEMAKALDTIPYEILTKIGHRVKRVFYKE